MLARTLAAVALVTCLVALTGPGGAAPAAADVSCPASNPPDELTLGGGTPQTAKLDSPFSDMLQVALANTNGCPVTTQVAGTAVTFTAPGSGASGTFATSGSNAVTVGTNASGGASAPPFTANDMAGAYTVTASSSYGSVSFSLTNTVAGIAAAIAADAPKSQTATAGARYAAPLRATVLDASGKPIEGVSVTFTLGAAGGGGAGGSGDSTTAGAGATFAGGETQAMEVTNGSGVATSPRFTGNGTAGAFKATAATAGVVEPASFSLDNRAGKPPKLAALVPVKQTAIVGARYHKPLRVKVRDSHGKPVQGATVTFALGSGGGGGANADSSNGNGSPASGTAGATFADGSTETTETTNAAGIATSPRFTANTTAGRFTAAATTTGTSKAVSFPLDNLAGRQPTIAPAWHATRSATVGAGFAEPLRVKVRDGSGKPVQGASVTFTLGASGGGSTGDASGSSGAGASFVGGSSQATETTNAAGVAVSPRFTANTTAGRYTATATTDGTAKAARFELRNRPGRPASISAGVAATESTTVGTRFPVRLAVTVEDADANPVPGALVRFTAPAGGPSGRFAGAKRTVEVRTDASGVAVAPPFRANGSQGGYVVRASVPGIRRAAAFALVNQAAS